MLTSCHYCRPRSSHFDSRNGTTRTCGLRCWPVKRALFAEGLRLFPAANSLPARWEQLEEPFYAPTWEAALYTCVYIYIYICFLILPQLPYLGFHTEEHPASTPASGCLARGLTVSQVPKWLPKPESRMTVEGTTVSCLVCG